MDELVGQRGRGKASAIKTDELLQLPIRELEELLLPKIAERESWPILDSDPSWVCRVEFAVFLLEISRDAPSVLSRAEVCPLRSLISYPVDEQGGSDDPKKGQLDLRNFLTLQSHRYVIESLRQMSWGEEGCSF